MPSPQTELQPIRLFGEQYRIDARCLGSFIDAARSVDSSLDSAEALANYFRSLQKFMGQPHFYLATPQDPLKETGTTDKLCLEAHLKSGCFYGLATLPLLAQRYIAPGTLSAQGMELAQQTERSAQNMNPSNNNAIFLRDPLARFCKAEAAFSNLANAHFQGLAPKDETRIVGTSQYQSWNFPASSKTEETQIASIIENGPRVLRLLQSIHAVLQHEGFFLKRNASDR